MEAEVIFKSDTRILIKWESDKIGFGHLLMIWNPVEARYSLDCEHLGIDTVISIFKALPELISKQ